MITKEKKRKFLIISILALMYTLMQCIGYRISIKYETSVHLYDAFSGAKILSVSDLLLCGILGFLWYLGTLYLLFSIFEKLSDKKKNFQLSRVTCGICWLAVAILLILCWMPCYKAGYPGYFNYDAVQQVPQAMYDEVPYSAHHPLLHTLLMGKIIKFGYEQGETLNDGIVWYSWFQMIVCALFFSGFCLYIMKLTKRVWLGILGILWYALMPTIALFTMSTTKDPIFSLLLQSEVLLMYQCIRAKEKKATSWLLLILVGTLMCLFRKNGVYALLCVVPLCICVAKKLRLKILLSLGMILACYVVISESLCAVLKAEKGSPEEMLSVPMQQIARVYCARGESAFSVEELELIYQGISQEQLLRYNPFLSDNIKNYFDYNAIEGQKTDYLLMWLRKGIQYPKEYIGAFLDNTYQAWYPGTSIYDGHRIYYFGMDMLGGAERETKNQKYLDFYTRIAEEVYYQRTPVLRLFFSIGAMFWVALFTTTYAIYRKDEALIIAMSLVMGTCLTVFLGPVSLVRYYLILFYGFPVNIAFLFVAKKNSV